MQVITWTKGVVKYLIWTIIEVLLSLGLPGMEWTHLFHEGAWWGRNPFPNADGTISTTNFTNFFFTITGFHGFHVFFRSGYKCNYADNDASE